MIYSGVLQLISRWQGYLPIIALILVSGLSDYLYLEGVILFDIHQESFFCRSATQFQPYNQDPDVDASSTVAFFSSLPDAPLSRFFLVKEWFKDYAEANIWLLNAVEKERLKYRENIIEGIENAPQAFIDLLDSKHFGKQLVRL